MNKKQYIIAFALILASLLAAATALKGEVYVVSISPSYLLMDYNDKKAIVDGQNYYLAQKAVSIIPASSSVLFVNLSREALIPFSSQKMMYYVAPRSILEVRSLPALGKVRISDYDYVLFHSFKAIDAFSFMGLYPDLNTLYSSRTDSGFYALYAVRQGGID